MSGYAPMTVCVAIKLVPFFQSSAASMNKDDLFIFQSLSVYIQDPCVMQTSWVFVAAL